MVGGLVPGDPTAQLEQLDSGALDAVLLLDEVGAAAPALALRAPHRVLAPVEGWASSDRGFRLPFVGAERVPPHSYRRVERPVPSVGMQRVLVGALASDVGLGGGGPAAALDRSPTALEPAERDQLALSLSTPVDPALPRRRSEARRRASLPLQPAVTVANLGAFAFIGFLMWVLLGGRRVDGA